MAQQFSTNLGLSALPEIDQSKYGDVFTEILRIRGALKILQTTLDLYTGIFGEDPTYWSTANTTWIRLQNLTRLYAKAGVDIPAGRLVSFYNVGGILTAKIADAATSTPAHAYCTTAVKAGDTGEFFLEGLITLANLIPGTTYYLGNSGLVTITAGQVVGLAVSTTQLFFRPTLA